MSVESRTAPPWRRRPAGGGPVAGGADLGGVLGLPACASHWARGYSFAVRQLIARASERPAENCGELRTKPVRFKPSLLFS
jgi:hypothetical protein